ncbi:hypothetical protein A4G17_01815 [Frederiksenia canicola]|uniref:Sel1 repeat-containing protein n=1 Tax=Frederiksenia canicola TaxID=123824 RepID=A0AAE6X8I6_9PAST|nr:hypothetical protein A4G17_01815 [Frederiksenia canicola]
MNTSDTQTAKPLFDKAIEHNQKRLKLAKQLTDKQKGIEQQGYAQSTLGRCYLEQAINTSDTQIAESLFDKAIEHHQERLKLAKLLTDEQKRIEKQIYAQDWLGYCYFKQAINTSDTQIAESLFDKAIEHNQERLNLAKQLTDKQKRIEKQVYAQFWLGRCYLEQAINTSDTQISEPLFDKAIKHHTKGLELATQLADKQKSIEQQYHNQSWLGYCYLEHAIKTADEKTTKPLFDKAIEHHTKWFELATQLTDKQKRIEQQGYSQYWLGRCHFEQAIKTSDEQEVTSLFKEAIQHKVNYTHQTLFERSTNKHQKSISEILASLSIFPFEASNTTFAHYTNPDVTELLFGLKETKNEDSEIEKSPKPMRMNSATYMNDPYEGKSLFEFLGIPEASLENITEFPKYNAFFSCFSHRVNDLNQFRLYGKEDGVEASGCCLVFNKNRKWLKQIDIAKSFSSMKNEREIGSPISSSEKHYSLYQIAYIAYLDDYIDRNKCEIITTKPDEKFAIYLPKVGNSDEWHRIRVEKLKKALKDLREEISKTNNEIEKQDLEYIRYLFKDFAFRDEEEFRILTLKEIGKETECCDKTNSVFVPYADISNMVDEVILGTNYEKTNQKRKVEVFRHKMKEHFPDVKITHSSLPINANPPTKKDS